MTQKAKQNKNVSATNLNKQQLNVAKQQKRKDKKMEKQLERFGQTVSFSYCNCWFINPNRVTVTAQIKAKVLEINVCSQIICCMSSNIRLPYSAILGLQMRPCACCFWSVFIVYSNGCLNVSRGVNCFHGALEYVRLYVYLFKQVGIVLKSSSRKAKDRSIWITDNFEDQIEDKCCCC